MLYDNGGLPAPQRPTGAYRTPSTGITPPVRTPLVPPPAMTPKFMRQQKLANMPPSMRRVPPMPPLMGGGMGGVTIGGWGQGAGPAGMMQRPPSMGGLRYARRGGIATPMAMPQQSGMMPYGQPPYPQQGQRNPYMAFDPGQYQRNPYLPMVTY